MKRTQIKRRPLADSVLHSLEPEAKSYQEKDSYGLYLRVKPSGTKSWLFRYKKPSGQWGWKGLGGFPAVSGKLARQKAQEWQKTLSDGESIEVDTGIQESVTTFEVAAENWFQRKIDIGRAKDSNFAVPALPGYGHLRRHSERNAAGSDYAADVCPGPSSP